MGKSFPFIGQSLFMGNPLHDTDDVIIFNHVLKALREDFKLTVDSDGARFQILLGDAVEEYTRLAIFRATKHDPERFSADYIEDYERKLRKYASRALESLMKYTNPKLTSMEITGPVEEVISKVFDEPTPAT